MRRCLWIIGTVVSLGALSLAACSSSSSSGADNLFTGGTTSTGATSGTGGAPLFGGSGGTGGGIVIDGGGNSGGGGNDGGVVCSSGPNDDKDKDGFTVSQGDCNDCDANVNPGAIDVLHTDDGGSNWGDEDCDGTPGSSATLCDDNIALDDVDPFNAAKTIELCNKASATDKKWGVIDAQWVRADGSPLSAPGLQVGVQPDFGPNVHPQGGKRMLALSTGNARTPSQPGACGSKSCEHNAGGTPPAGFPQDTAGCDGSNEINDDVALQVKLRAPTNATGYSFSFRFYSFEYPEWVCTSFNDQFITLVDPAPAGSVLGNICFDSKKNPVTVNIGFFDVCSGCPAGTNDLVGNGFDTWDDAGATVWLTTQAPVKGGEEVTLRFAIWDTGDQLWDSTALIDNFQWIANGGTVTVGTSPIPTPK
jgi:hypothetical protein